ncbi:MAG: DNA mismatch repair protein MutS [Deltaproteobacteria bacterium]|jgi:hypothetical protein|nr:DNA mismatch repair protein MutS [Deltaproteobacteria bacterium]MBT6431591.1 DNA mismatch repair protein MutS [Deltaproteobacteria bacterium]
MSQESAEAQGVGREQSPELQYRKLLDERKAALSKMVSLDNLNSNIRLVLFLMVFGLGLGFVYSEVVPGLMVVVGALVFLFFVVSHNRVIRVRRYLESSCEYFHRALDRLGGDWIGRGDTGAEFGEGSHLYVADLDICGEGSAFELISQAQTEIGRKTIADWLLNPGSLSEAKIRQARIRDLEREVELRESLVASHGDRREKIRPAGLKQWVEQSAELEAGRDSAVFVGLLGLSLAGVIAWAVTDWGVVVFLGALIAQGITRMIYKKRVMRVLSAVSGAHVELEQMARILTLFEEAKFPADGAMTRWRAGLDVEGESISTRIRGLSKLVHRADAMKNQLFMLVGFYFGWDHLAAVRVESWRMKEQPHLPNWLATLGEFEALISFSCYAFEHPENYYPEFETRPGVLKIDDMRHPLLGTKVAVGNDIELGSQMPLLLISGSNMSGKSTLLRGVGLNVVLAMCGVPVCAKKMRLSAFKVGATLSIHDSLMSGESRFYAEISRIQGLVEVSRSEHTLLFLIDEILHGTNSFDRRKGARAILESMLNDGSVGFVTTHDLALAQMADDWPDRATNMHLSDRLDGQALVFDYRLKPGVVQQSNAIELMRSVGLPV